MSVKFFAVKNFEQFQHYKDRSPPWIKLYNDVLDDYLFSNLPDSTKAHLMQIWLLASKNNNKLPLDPQWIGQRISARTKVDLDALIDAGFICEIKPNQQLTGMGQGDSGALAGRKQDAPLEEKRRGEESCDSQRDKSLAEFMFQKIKTVMPKTKPPNLDKWADTIRLMRERDELSRDEIQSVFEWANADEFWRMNILSPAKLREQFSRLSVLAEKKQQQQTFRGPGI